MGRAGAHQQRLDSDAIFCHSGDRELANRGREWTSWPQVSNPITVGLASIDRVAVADVMNSTTGRFHSQNLGRGEQMNFGSIRVVATSILVGALASGALIAGPAAATGSTQTVKEKAAIAAYAKTMTRARLAYFAQVKPSRAAVVSIGKPAELKRRAQVASGLATFKATVRLAKAPSLAAEAAYRSAAAKSTGSPGDAALKVVAKSSLNALNKATAALKIDPNVAAARATFAKVRAGAMAKFRATIAASVAKRFKAQARASARFKATKMKALARLKIALKAARA